MRRPSSSSHERMAKVAGANLRRRFTTNGAGGRSMLHLPWPNIKRPRKGPFDRLVDEDDVASDMPFEPRVGGGAAAAAAMSAAEAMNAAGAVPGAMGDCFGVFRAWFHRTLGRGRSARRAAYEATQLQEALERLGAARLCLGSKIAAANHQVFRAEKDILTHMNHRDVRRATEALRSKKFFEAKVARLEAHQRCLLKNEMMLHESQTNKDVFAALSEVSGALKRIGITPTDLRTVDRTYGDIQDRFDDVREASEAMAALEPLDAEAPSDSDLYEELLAYSGGHDVFGDRTPKRQQRKPAAAEGAEDSRSAAALAVAMPSAPTRAIETTGEASADEMTLI
ncbi:MAG: hypothetical protein CMF70_06710 [Magnetovibrio sp.]|nr:hypothetical protein [Magnetovibrio sp.]